MPNAPSPFRKTRRPPKERDYSSQRRGDEAYVSGQLFAVRLSAQGVEEGRDFVAAGLPIVPMGMVSTADRSVIFGTSRLQAALVSRGSQPATSLMRAISSSTALSTGILSFTTRCIAFAQTFSLSSVANL